MIYKRGFRPKQSERHRRGDRMLPTATRAEGIAVIDTAESRTVTGKRVAVGPPY